MGVAEMSSRMKKAPNNSHTEELFRPIILYSIT
jgi:hypothetical protein